MPIKSTGYDHLYEFSGPVGPDEIEALVGDGAIRTLQTAQTDDKQTLALLDASFFARRPDVTLRLYGFYGRACDLSVARELRHVRRLCANCLNSAIHVEDIASMPQLEELELGVYDAQSFDFLERVPASLRVLSLEGTRSKKPGLGMLPRFQQLESLSLEGHHKGIEGIAELRTLKKLALRSISLPDLDFLGGLKSLQSLELRLGCIRSLTVLESLNLRYLEIWRVKDLSDLDFLKGLKTLQYLFLEALPHVESLPGLQGLSSLRRLRLESMKNLREFAPIAQAPCLEEFCILQVGLDPALLWPVLRMPSLRKVMGLLGSESRNAELRTMLTGLNLESFRGERFAFL